MQLILALIGCAATGVICYQYSSKKGYEPRLWMALGFCFGLLGLLTLFLLPVKKKPSSQAKSTLKLQAIDPAHGNQLWYYLDLNNQHLGPMSADALTRAWKEGKVNRTTYVWNEMMDGWKRLEETFTENTSENTTQKCSASQRVK